MTTPQKRDLAAEPMASIEPNFTNEQRQGQFDWQRQSSKGSEQIRRDDFLRNHHHDTRSLTTTSWLSTTWRQPSWHSERQNQAAKTYLRIISKSPSLAVTACQRMSGS
jgi:hypothetical protein